MKTTVLNILASTFLLSAVVLGESQQINAYDVPPDVSQYTQTLASPEYDFIFSDNTIKGYTGPGGAVEIPSYINGEPVRTIGTSAFSGNTTITSLSVPSTVDTIEDYAFQNQLNLQSISLPQSVYYLGAAAFSGCSSLTSIDLPDKIYTLHEDTFADCTNLKTVKLPNNLKILYGSFFNCTSLSSISIPATVTYLGDACFDGCPNLSTILFGGTLGGTLNEIGFDPFSDTAWFKNLYNSASGNYVITGDGALLAIKVSEPSSFLVIPEGVRSIVGGNLADPSGVKSIIFPSTLEYINSNAFLNYSDLESITFQLSQTVTIYDNAFFNTNLKEIVNAHVIGRVKGSAFGSNLTSDSFLPLITTSTDTYARLGGSFIKYNGTSSYIEIPYGVTTLGSKCFQSLGQHNIGEVVLPTSLKTIESHTFTQATRLGALTIPNSVTTIEAAAFEYSNIQSLQIPDSVTHIGEAAFYFMGNLETITLSNSLEYIEEDLFRGCYNLKSVTFGNSTKAIYADFNSSTLLQTVVIPSSVEYIPANIFATYSVNSNKYVLHPNLTVYGHSGSYAHTYCNEHGIPFIDMNTGLVPPTVTPDYTPNPDYSTDTGCYDVPSNAWYAHHVAYVLNRGFMTRDNYYFYPEQSCNRGTIAQTIVNILGVNPVGSTHNFIDISGSIYEDAIAWCTNAGLLTGYNNIYFGPVDYLTREQYVSCLRTLANYYNLNTSVAVDQVVNYYDGNQVSSWARTSMMWALEQGLLQGYDGYLNPKSYINRAEVAVMLRSFALKYGV